MGIYSTQVQCIPSPQPTVPASACLGGADNIWHWPNVFISAISNTLYSLAENESKRFSKKKEVLSLHQDIVSVQTANSFLPPPVHLIGAPVTLWDLFEKNCVSLVIVLYADWRGTNSKVV